MAGQCCIKTYSKGQGAVSLSAGEAEYYPVVSGASDLLSQVSTALDWVIKTECGVYMHASARCLWYHAEVLERLSVWKSLRARTRGPEDL